MHHFGPSWGPLRAILGPSCGSSEGHFCATSSRIRHLHLPNASRFFQSCSHVSFLPRSVFVRRHRGFGTSGAVLWPLWGSKMASRGPKMAPRWVQDGPAMATRGSKMAARSPKMFSGWPQDPPNGFNVFPRWLQEVIRWPQGVSRWSQEPQETHQEQHSCFGVLMCVCMLMQMRLCKSGCECGCV